MGCVLPCRAARSPLDCMHSCVNEPLEYDGRAAGDVDLKAQAAALFELRVIHIVLAGAVHAAEVQIVGGEDHLISAFSHGVHRQEEVGGGTGGVEVEHIHQLALGEGDDLAGLVDPQVDGVRFAQHSILPAEL